MKQDLLAYVMCDIVSKSCNVVTTAEYSGSQVVNPATQELISIKGYSTLNANYQENIANVNSKMIDSQGMALDVTSILENGCMSVITNKAGTLGQSDMSMCVDAYMGNPYYNAQFLAGGMMFPIDPWKFTPVGCPTSNTQKYVLSQNVIGCIEGYVDSGYEFIIVSEKQYEFNGKISIRDSISGIITDQNTKITIKILA